MKFLSTESTTLEDKESGIKLVALVVTNRVRFAMFDLVQSETMEGRLDLAEYIFKNCVESLTVGGKSVEPLDMLGADLSDEDTSTVYFSCVDLIINHVLLEASSNTKK